MGDSSSARRQAIITAPVGQQLISLTTPMLFAVLAIMSLGLVDSYFISLLGTKQLAAIGFLAPVAAVVQNIGLAVGMAVSSLNSKLVGANKMDSAARLVTDGFYFTALIAILVSVVLFWQQATIFKLLGAKPEIIIYTKEYLIYWLIAVPFLLFTTVCSSALRSIGDTKSSAIISITLTISNIILDPILIFGLGPIPALGVSGAALATLISLILTSSIAAHKLMVVNKLLLITLPQWQAFKSNLNALLQIAIPAIFANVLIPLTAAVITRIIAQFGTQAVAGFGVGMRLEAIMLIAAYALSATLPMFIGQNLGAEKPERVYRASHLAFTFILIFQVALYLIVLLFSQPIAALFSQKTEVIEVIQSFLWIVPISYGFMGVVILINVSMNVLGKPRLALFINLLRLCAFYAPLCYIGAQLFSIKGVFIAMAVCNISLSIIAYLLLKNLFRDLGISKAV